MSGLWTPSGEQPPPPGPGPGAGGSPGAPSADELDAVREVHAQLRATPAPDVLANHAIGLCELALIYLGVATPPDDAGRVPAPDLAGAGLVIDALAAIVDGLGSRLGEHEGPLRDALQQTQVVYVRVAEALHGDGGTAPSGPPA